MVMRDIVLAVIRLAGRSDRVAARREVSRAKRGKPLRPSRGAAEREARGRAGGSEASPGADGASPIGEGTRGAPGLFSPTREGRSWPGSPQRFRASSRSDAAGRLRAVRRAGGAGGAERARLRAGLPRPDAGAGERFRGRRLPSRPSRTGSSIPGASRSCPTAAMLVTERPGRLRVVAADGSVSEPIAGVPEVVGRRPGRPARRRGRPGVRQRPDGVLDLRQADGRRRLRHRRGARAAVGGWLAR